MIILVVAAVLVLGIISCQRFVVLAVLLAIRRMVFGIPISMLVILKLLAVVVTKPTRDSDNR
ncbi:MAG: hypothetical protein WCK42_06545 [Myxococcaceae bacterium]